MQQAAIASVLFAAGAEAWGKHKPAPPPPNADLSTLISDAILSTPGLLLLLALILAIAFVVSMRPSNAKNATGKEVSFDYQRRQQAKTSQGDGTDRPLQMLCLAALVIPHIFCIMTQESPTVYEQVRAWADLSWQHFKGPWQPSIIVGTAVLSIERLCYTWVHTNSLGFVKFCATPLGQAMGKKPIDVVLTMFFLNKVLQIGTFVGFYFYTINFESPFAPGNWSLEESTRFQWVCLCQGLIIGQGLNSAIYRAIGKNGVYYGHRLGLSTPWVTGFPFSVLGHPQYIGVCFSLMGINIFCATTRHVTAGWFNLTIIQILYYVYMGLVEDYL